MNKEKLVKVIAKETDIPVYVVKAVLEAFIHTVIDTTARGDGIRLTGFGIFGRRRRSARVGRNLKTGERVEIPQRSVPFFRPGARFTAAMEAVQCE